MLSVWAYAPHSVQLCAVSADTGDPVVEAQTGTEPAETCAAFPSAGREVDAGHLSVRTRAVPLSATCLCHRRTSGGQGIEKKTDNRAKTARRFTSTPRIRRVCRSGQCLASCLCRLGGPCTRIAPRPLRRAFPVTGLLHLPAPCVTATRRFSH